MNTILQESTASPLSPERTTPLSPEDNNDAIYLPDALVTKMVSSYMFRVEIIIKAITNALKKTRDPSRREILANSLKDATAVQNELAAMKKSTPATLEFIKSEIRRCNAEQKACIDINDIYNRECNICKSSDSLYTTSVQSLAKEYVRVTALRGR
jgi:hypothetical protein